MRAPFIVVAAGAAALLTFAAPASAQNTRSFVSGHGSDNNPCSLAAPCRTFAQAVSQTNPKGEVAVLDTAGYGPVTINKAISIVNQDGIEAGVTAPSGNDAVTIAAEPNDVVTLRGLTITGGGVGFSGIKFTSGAGLKIENCDVSDFMEYGINIQPSAATRFTITDTVVSNNGIDGIFISQTNTPPVIGILARVTLVNNNNGLQISEAAGGLPIFDVTLTNSIVSNNNNNGVSTFGNLNLNLSKSEIIGNLAGLSTDIGPIFLSQVLLDNPLGADITDTTGKNTAQIFSYQNNSFQITRFGTTITNTSLR